MMALAEAVDVKEVSNKMTITPIEFLIQTNALSVELDGVFNMINSIKAKYPDAVIRVEFLLSKV